MPRLINVNMRIGYAFEVTTPCAGTLPEEPGGGGMVVTSIVVPEEHCEPGEVLRVRVGGNLCFRWSVEHLISRYRRFCALSGPPKLTAIARAMMAFCERPPGVPSDPLVLGEVLRSLGTAFHQLMGSPGLPLERAVVIEHDEQFVVETDKGSQLRVLLAGLRTIEQK